MRGYPRFTAPDQRNVLLGYWEHVIRSAEVSLEIYSQSPYVQAMTICGCRRAIADALGSIAVLEEYGIEQWQATNHAEARA